MSHKETVILVHGLWLHGAVMLLMKRRIEARGYNVLNYSYPSVRLSLRENAKRLARYAGALAQPVHFVGHSLGAVVALKAAEMIPPSQRGRLVLLGPPFRDSFSGRRLQTWPGGSSVLGRCMRDWLSEERATTLADCDIGVIAGDAGFIGLARLIARDLPPPHDGVVSVEETRFPQMKDHVVLPVSHTPMMVSRDVVHQTCAFLSRGHFDRESVPAALSRQ